jgi:tetratricopeptide (TPR) repeat protein
MASARGDFPAALQLANQAVAIAEASRKAGQGGDDFLSSTLVLRSDVYCHLGRADDAATDAARALNVLKKSEEPGTFSSYIGHAYYTMGRALQAQGKSGEAYAAFQSAAENLQATLGPDHLDTRNARRAEFATRFDESEKNLDHLSQELSP